jgi:transcriptional regulator with GAF, ATPase, and Fis domain
MRRLFEQLGLIAPSDGTVLIQGETGSGKELVAQELHRHSARREGPFHVVDCSALPESLIEAELFGHERGAFTGAQAARPGAFEAAQGGTLFLDEIGELPPALQARLLRALEARTVKRLGSNDWRPVDVRLIAATHQDLAELCNQRLFREDLYFRLSVLRVRVPPLRERLDDIPLLVRTILDELGAPEGLAVDDALLALLRSRAWRGNVRELRNTVQRALVLGRAALDEPTGDGAPALTTAAAAATIEPYKIAKARAVEAWDRGYLLNLLSAFGGNVAKAARASELDPAWIFRLVKRYGIDLAVLRQNGR